MKNKKLDINIYEYFNSLTLDDFFELLKSSHDENEKKFYTKIWNLSIQERQKKIVEAGIF